MRATPIATSSALFDTKYGYTISAMPQISGIATRCFRPYTKKPSPMELNMRPSSSDEVSTSVLVSQIIALRQQLRAVVTVRYHVSLCLRSELILRLWNSVARLHFVPRNRVDIFNAGLIAKHRAARLYAAHTDSL